MDYESLLMGVINNRLTKEVNKSQQSAERESRGVPNSSRRAFESRMKTDAAVARVAAQNMEDAKAMVNVAQTNVTAIKSQLQEMRTILSDCANQDSMTLGEYTQANIGLQDRMQEIENIVKNASFNGMKLMDDSAGDQAGNHGNVEIMAFNVVRPQKFMNMLDGSGNQVTASSTSMDLSASTLAQYLSIDDTIDVDTAKSSAQAALDTIDQYIEAVAGLEARYSFDYKSLDNLSMLFEEQADIYEDASTRASNSNSLSSSAILSELLNAGNSSILSGNA